jgi:hypothetical protein
MYVYKSIGDKAPNNAVGTHTNKQTHKQHAQILIESAFNQNILI